MEDIYCDFDGVHKDFCSVCERPASFELRRAHEGDVPCGAKLKRLYDKKNAAQTKGIGNTADNSASTPLQNKEMIDQDKIQFGR